MFKTEVVCVAGVTQQDLAPLHLDAGQATALINSLLHLQRLRLDVFHGVTTYTLITP